MAKHSKQTLNVRSIVIIFILACICAILAMSVVRLYKKNRTASHTREQYQQEYNELLDKQENIEAKLEAMESERGVEEALRSRYNVVREGEEMITVIDNKEDNTQETAD